ncbi:MAG: DUF2092 domain-containing protein [Burkholderiales bacterium]
MFTRIGWLVRLMAALAPLAAAALPQAAAAQPAGIDPQATAILKRSMDFLAGLKAFSVDAHSTIEATLTSGQKLQFDSASTVTLQRPDKLVARRGKGDVADQSYYYDGKTLTLFNPGPKYYATLKAPPTIEQALDFARDSLDVVAPAGDLLYRDAYEMLMQDTTVGFVVGKAFVGGARCDHLAFRKADVDWQIWIQEGATPLPRKYVITSTKEAGTPDFTVVMTKWNVAPQVSDAIFAFRAPQGAKRVDFLKVGGAK